MEKLKDLLKRSFDLLVKKRWLKEINRAVDRYNKSRDRLQADTHVLTELIKRYNEIYSKDPLQVKHINRCRAEWLFWEGWTSNHDMRIDDAVCSSCGYKHPTVRRTPYSLEIEQDVLNKLSRFCPCCGKRMREN
jgi:hypothetical protein